MAPGLGDAPRYAAGGTAARVAACRDELTETLVEYLTPDLIEIAGRLVPLPGGELPWSGPRAECVVHDAHAPDHLALFVEQWGVLVCGDMLSDVELPMPADADVDLEIYRTGLQRLRDAAARARWLIPGHGSVTDDPVARFDADMRYLDDVLSGRPTDDPRILDPENRDLHLANLGRSKGRASGGPEV